MPTVKSSEDQPEHCEIARDAGCLAHMRGELSSRRVRRSSRSLMPARKASRSTPSSGPFASAAAISSADELPGGRRCASPRSPDRKAATSRTRRRAATATGCRGGHCGPGRTPSTLSRSRAVAPRAPRDRSGRRWAAEIVEIGRPTPDDIPAKVERRALLRLGIGVLARDLARRRIDALDGDEGERENNRLDSAKDDDDQREPAGHRALRQELRGAARTAEQGAGHHRASA